MVMPTMAAVTPEFQRNAPANTNPGLANGMPRKRLNIQSVSPKPAFPANPYRKATQAFACKRP